MSFTKENRKFFHIFLLMVLVCICYSNSLQTEWHFDDYHNIVDNNNIHITSLSWEEVKGTFYHPLSGKISRPVAFLSFALNYYFSGLDTTSYHVVNISVHIICAIFVYLVLLQTLNIYYGNKKHTEPELFCHDIALLGAVLWALHPIQTQAVTYTVQRMASMAAMFYMIAFYCYLRFRTCPEKSDKIKFMLIMVICLFAGVLTKDNIIVFPLALIVFEIAFFNISLQHHKKNILLLIACFTVIAVVAVLLMYDVAKIFNLFSFERRSFTMWQRLITQPIILSRYIFLLLSPSAYYLTLESEIAASTGLLSPPITLFANLFIISLLLTSVFFLRRFPIPCFAVLFYFINHLIESTIFPLELYFEHRNYLPSIFIYFALSFYVLQALNYVRHKHKVFQQGLIFILLTAILISEGHATYQRNNVWKTEISFWEDTVSKTPLNPRPHSSLGLAYEKYGRYDDALKEYLIALKLDPDNALTHYNLGILFIELDRIEDAITELQNVIQLESGNPKAHNNLGIAYEKLERIDDAAREYLIAKELAPGDANAPYNLGKLYDMQGLYENAIKEYETAIQADPDFYKAYNNLAINYYRVGRIDDAIKQLITAIQLNPTSPGAHFNLGNMYGGQGRFEEALREFQTVLRLDPDHKGARQKIESIMRMSNLKN